MEASASLLSGLVRPRAEVARLGLVPVWVHGDVSEGNLLIRDGGLHAVIDFGNLCVGDPACDLVLAWTLLDADGRTALRDLLSLDEAAWDRARGWALWKALITVAKAR